tara:strand:+ start:546 stop:1355 length:810 start_codon:yes stop_codon:yes gene_type:complete
MAESSRTTRAAKNALDAEQDGADPGLRKRKLNGPSSFRVQKQGGSDIMLPSSVYQGPSVAALEDVTQRQKFLQQGYTQRPGEKGYRVPVDDDLYGRLEGRAARLEEGQSFPEDISERDKMLEKFPLPSYEEAGRMQGKINPIFEEMLSAKRAEKFGAPIGRAMSAVNKTLPHLDPFGATAGVHNTLFGDGITDDERDELFQEAGREYLRRRRASQEEMEDTPSSHNAEIKRFVEPPVLNEDRSTKKKWKTPPSSRKTIQEIPNVGESGN